MDSQKDTVDLGFDRAALIAHAWDKFRPKLDAVRSLDEALALLTETTAVGSPSHAFYANLTEFLRTWEPPRHAWTEELAAYRRLVERLVSENALDAGLGAKALAAITSSSARLR